MKKLLIFLLIASLCTFLYACGCDNDNPPATSPSDTAGDATASTPSPFEGELDGLDPSGDTTSEAVNTTQNTGSENEYATKPTEDTKPIGETVSKGPTPTTTTTTAPSDPSEDTTAPEDVTTSVEPSTFTAPTEATTEPTQAPTTQTTVPEETQQPTIPSVPADSPTNSNGEIEFPPIPG